MALNIRNKIQLRREIKEDLRELIAAYPDATNEERAEILAERYGLDLPTILAILKELMPFIMMLIELFKK